MEEAFCHFDVSHSSRPVLQVSSRPINENEAFEKTLPFVWVVPRSQRSMGLIMLQSVYFLFIGTLETCDKNARASGSAEVSVCNSASDFQLIIYRSTKLLCATYLFSQVS